MIRVLSRRFLLILRGPLFHGASYIFIDMEHHRVPEKLRLNKALDHLGVDNRDALWRAAVNLLLQGYHLGAASLALSLGGDLHPARLRPPGEGEKLVQIEPCELLAHQGT